MGGEKRVAIYCRVSTKDQSCDMQLDDLQRYSGERGFEVFKVYTDPGISGTKEKRPALDELMDDARKRKFNMVLCWDFSRFARSTRHLITALEEFDNLKIDFVSYRENIDTSSPLGKMVFTLISAFAELEKSLIRERVMAGLRRARVAGKRSGAPMLEVDADLLAKLREQGLSIRKIAGEMNISRSTVERRLNGGKKVEI